MNHLHIHISPTPVGGVNRHIRRHRCGKTRKDPNIALPCPIVRVNDNAKKAIEFDPEGR